MAETAERTVRGRTSRRQRFVVASVGAEPRRFLPGRAAGPERADVGTRRSDFVSGDFRREGMGAPREFDDSPAQLTASRPVPSFGRPCHANSRAFFRSAANKGRTFRVCATQNVIGRGSPSRRATGFCPCANAPTAHWGALCWPYLRRDRRPEVWYPPKEQGQERLYCGGCNAAIGEWRCQYRESGGAGPGAGISLTTQAEVVHRGIISIKQYRTTFRY